MGKGLGFLLVLASLVAGGCGGDDESSDSASSDDGSAAVGDAQTVDLPETGFDHAPTTLEVTLLSVEEGAKPDPDRVAFGDTEPGNVFAKLEFELTNTGDTDQFGQLPGAVAIDAEGNEYDSLIGPSPFAPGLLETRLDAGDSQTGYEAVEMPKGSVIETVELTIDKSDPDAETVSWSVGP